MYGESRIISDVTLTGPTTFATNQATGAQGNSLRFQVEEEEMFTVLEFQGTLDQTVADELIDATFFVDGVDVMAPLVDGVVSTHAGAVAAGAAVQIAFYMKKTVRLAQGEHRIEARFRSPSGDIIIRGLLRPAVLSATRLSSNATVAANMTSKQVTGVF